VTDDKRLVIWDIFPESSLNESGTPREASMDSISQSILPRGNAETWTVQFMKTLHSVATHSAEAKLLLVADTCGSVYLVDWELCRSAGHSIGGQVLMEFIEPYSLAHLIFSPTPSYTGSVSWKTDDSNTYVHFWVYHSSDEWLLDSQPPLWIDG
jgi:hypothetical protein